MEEIIIKVDRELGEKLIKEGEALRFDPPKERFIEEMRNVVYDYVDEGLLDEDEVETFIKNSQLESKWNKIEDSDYINQIRLIVDNALDFYNY